MTRPARRRGDQPDLLEWQPPEPVARFEDVRVRSASIAGRLARGISQALGDCGRGRSEVAQAMSVFLGTTVSKNMLDAYCSEARSDHVISVTRFAALLHATGDRRLLELLAEMMGWAVIERRYLPLIELAAARERQDSIGNVVKAARRRAQAGGAL